MNRIHVNQSVTFLKNKPVIGTTKTRNAVRTIPLHPNLRATLFNGHEIADGDAYVITKDGNPISEQTQIRMWERIKRTINLYGMTAHNFRHRNLSLFAREHAAEYGSTPLQMSTGIRGIKRSMLGKTKRTTSSWKGWGLKAWED